MILTYKRQRFSELVTHNINIQDYDNIKEVIVLDDGGEPLELDDVKYPVRYIQSKDKMTIGKKRNTLIKMAKTKYCAFMDDDDIYYPTYLSHSISVLKDKKKMVVGSADMLFYYLGMKESGRMSCKMINLLHEATMVFDRKFVKTNMKFGETNNGEGKDFLKGYEKFIWETDIQKVMVCLAHSGNTVGKERWYKPELGKMDLKIDSHLEIISTLNI